MKCPYYKGKTKDDVIGFLIDRGIVDKFGNVKDYANFHKEVNRLSRLAYNRYSNSQSITQSDRVLLIEDGTNGKKYIPNNYILEQIDQAKIDGWNIQQNNNFWDNIKNDGTDIDPNKKC